MELRQYAEILLKRWWIIVPLTLISITGALLISYTRPPVYQATSTYISRVRTAGGDSSNTLYAIETTQRQNVFVTYCQVMTSEVIRKQAFKMIGIDSDTFADAKQYQVICNVLPSANVLLVIVQGPSPKLVESLNAAVGIAGTARSDGLFAYSGLDPLDPPKTEEVASSANRSQFGVLGGILGLVVGVALAFVIEYSRSPLERMEMLSIRNAKLGVYNERYFRQRLAEEINRARIRHRPISVALLKLIPSEDFSLMPDSAQDMLLRSIALWMQDTIREGDIIASVGNQTFAILLPETPGDEAQEVLTRLHNDIRSQTFGAADYVTNFSANTGLVEASGGNLDLKAMLARASEALATAEQNGENSIQLVRTSPRPFDFSVEAAEEMPVPSLTSSSNLPFTGGEIKELPGSSPAFFSLDEPLEGDNTQEFSRNSS